MNAIHLPLGAKARRLKRGWSLASPRRTKVERGYQIGTAFSKDRGLNFLQIGGKAREGRALGISLLEEGL